MREEIAMSNWSLTLVGTRPNSTGIKDDIVWKALQELQRWEGTLSLPGLAFIVRHELNKAIGKDYHNVYNDPIDADAVRVILAGDQDKEPK
jgi:hypothetical protein